MWIGRVNMYVLVMVYVSFLEIIDLYRKNIFLVYELLNF